MNRERIEGSWMQLHGKLREQWGLLVADRFSVVAGRHEQCVGKARARYGRSQEASNRQLMDFFRRNRRWFQVNR